MKKELIYIFLISLFSISSIFAQNPLRPNALIGKRIFTDYYSPSTSDFTDFDNYRGGFEIDYLRNLSSKVNAVIPLKIGVVNLPGEENNRTTIGLGFSAQLQHYRENNILIPYGTAGISGELEGFENTHFHIPVGAGLNIRLGRYAYVNIQSEFRISLDGDRDNFHHGVGLGFMIGKVGEDEVLEEIILPGLAKPDTDKDGIPDNDDICPEVAGLEAFNGCPDTDGDGIEDAMDQCPNDSGPKETQGCPDTDGDTISDDKDKCPTVAGTIQGCPDTDGDGIIDIEDKCPELAGERDASGCPQQDTDKDGVPDHLDQCPNAAGTLMGCPDTDGDGIADSKDKCPNSKGEGRFNGCPDTDGDGIIDIEDKCPNSPGPNMPNGCPEIAKEDVAILDYALQAVQFETGSELLKIESNVVLDQVVSVLSNYPDHQISITGHTDNVGLERNNEQLSIRRARTCYNYLVSRGVSPNRILVGGMGEMAPIADNESEEGRSLNRRVEFKLFPK